MAESQPRRTQFPESGEDWSLLQWWRAHPRQGWLWVEVNVGGAGPGDWPNRASTRRIDAVHVLDHPTHAVREWGPGSEQLTEAVRGRDVEIVEAKKTLTDNVIGQCLAGIDMFSRAYPAHGRLLPVAVVRGEPDPVLLWVCHRRGIEVVAYPEPEIQRLRHGESLPPFR